MSTVARRVVVHGRVQGVGYRFTMVGVASHAGVQGWVRNRRDGSVEAFVQGDGAAVLAVVAWCESGPEGSQVTDVEVFDVAPDPALRGFATRATD
jgi:acylphosphatase